MKRLTQIIEDKGPVSSTPQEILDQADLFAERFALFYTPTENISSNWIGTGPLDVTLPIPAPSWYEFYEIHSYQSPRLWFDLLQRATGKLRWTPHHPARLTIIRYDTIQLPYHAVVGAKALRDALKLKTTGRPDGRFRYYFGAILNDGPKDIIEDEFQQIQVSFPHEAKTRIIVQ